MNITINFDNALLGLLFIALIVLVVFLIILTAKLIGTVNRANATLDETSELINTAGREVSSLVSTVSNIASPKKLAHKGARAVASKAIRKR